MAPDECGDKVSYLAASFAFTGASRAQPHCFQRSVLWHVICFAGATIMPHIAAHNTRPIACASTTRQSVSTRREELAHVSSRSFQPSLLLQNVVDQSGRATSNSESTGRAMPRNGTQIT
jgi:hypothetical protein